MNNTPNYSEYSLYTLEDILKHIDKDKYPERVKLINEEIERKKADYELEQESEADESNVLTDERKHNEIVKLVSITSVVLLFSSYSVFTFWTIIISQFMLAYIPLFMILLLSMLSIYYLLKRNYLGVELLMYSQILLSFSFLLGKFYYFSNMGYLLLVGLSLGNGIGLIFDIDFGNFQFILGKVESKYSISLGVNIIPLILYAHLKWNRDYYKKVFTQ